MILDIVRQLGPWSWWVFGLVLLGLEVIVPGNVFVWFGVAALLTGALALFTDFGWQVELIVFVVLALVLVVAGRRLFGRQVQPGEQPFLNDRAHRLVGSSYMLSLPIVDGHGQVRIDDTNWRITGPDLPSGTRVKVVGADGAVLKVESAT
jgi:membrane protein implicated in regulation of membrane protease activity